MLPRIAVVQNSIEGLGTFEPVLSAAARLVVSRADLGSPLPSIDEFDGLIVLGGPASVYDDTQPIRDQIGLIRRVLAAGKPYLGVCLGAQLLAQAARARVYPGEAEHGVCSVKATDACVSDPLLNSVSPGSDLLVFQWHGDTFDLPTGATLLATGDACVHQAFRIGRAWGVQFHVEADVAALRHWLEGPERSGYDIDCARHRLDPAELYSRLAAVEDDLRPVTESMARGFLAEVSR